MFGLRQFQGPWRVCQTLALDRPPQARGAHVASGGAQACLAWPASPPCVKVRHAWPSACGRSVEGGLGPLAKRLLAERSKSRGGKAYGILKRGPMRLPS